MNTKTFASVALALMTMVPAVTPAQDSSPFGTWGNSRAKADVRQYSNPQYEEAIRRTAEMVGDADAVNLARRYGLDLLNLTWEDTGRYKGSSVGPNISDMTIQVDSPRQGEGRLMPVFRFPNFSDVTGDIDPQDITLLVGNQDGRRLKRTSLDDYLYDMDSYLTGRDKVQRNISLLAQRDTKVLVSAQACFLPVPQEGKATFTPVLFNYQSEPRNPAVLAIVATRQGTSATVIENNRDASESWGQKLFFNHDGSKAKFTGERLTDFDNRGGGRNEDPQSVANRAGLNMVMLIQVPLKHREERRFEPIGGAAKDSAAPTASAEKMHMPRRAGSDVENAVIGHGRDEGPFVEMDRLNVERDDRYPVRVTVQFYKATSNGIVSDDDVNQIKSDIDRVYRSTDSVGSLVTQGDTGRATEYYGRKVRPGSWWHNFWLRYQLATGEDADVAVRRLQRLMGREFQSQPVSSLYLRNLLRKP